MTTLNEVIEPSSTNTRTKADDADASQIQKTIDAYTEVSQKLRALKKVQICKVPPKGECYVRMRFEGEFLRGYEFSKYHFGKEIGMPNGKTEFVPADIYNILTGKIPEVDENGIIVELPNDFAHLKPEHIIVLGWLAHSLDENTASANSFKTLNNVC